MEVFALIALIVLNGSFAMSEIAVITARRSRLAQLAEAGDKRSRVALSLRDQPTYFLSTVQIGITSIGILTGMLGEDALAEPFSVYLQSLGLDPEASAITATTIVVICITYFAIVIGELVPKRLGQFHPEGVARVVARPMQFLSLISRPFVRLLSFSTELILRVLGRRESDATTITEEDIRATLAEGWQAGVLEREEHEMVRNVFRLDERQLGTVMTPRNDIVYLDVFQTYEENLRRLCECPHSRLPVCRVALMT